MSHYITTHNSEGKSVFSDKASTNQHAVTKPMGSVKMIASAHSFPMDLSTEDDIEQWKHDRERGSFPGGRICPSAGSAAGIITIDPNFQSGLHQTSTLDMIVITQGELELHMDSGEKRRLKAGDSLVLRNVMHKWVNVTPNNRHAQMVSFVQAIKEPVEI